MTNRPLTKAVLDFLTAVEMAAPGMASGMTLTLTDRLYTLLRDETPVLTGESLGKMRFWGGALCVARKAWSAGHPDCVLSKCIMPSGHEGPCLTSETMEALKREAESGRERAQAQQKAAEAMAKPTRA